MPTKRRKAERKETFIKIRVTDEQKKVFEEAAAREGLDLSSFARNTMIQRARGAGFKI
jgi:uncharacterized protein (DUF1778 family)